MEREIGQHPSDALLTEEAIMVYSEYNRCVTYVISSWHKAASAAQSYSSSVR